MYSILVWQSRAYIRINSISTLAIFVSLLLQLHSAHSYSHRRQHRDHALCSSQKRTILLPIVTNEYLYCVVFHLDSWWSPSRSCTYCLSLVTTDIISSNLILQNVTRIVCISQHERPTQYKLGDGHLSVVDTFTWCYHFLWPLLAPACPQYFFQRNTCFELCSYFKTVAVSDRDGRCLDRSWHLLSSSHPGSHCKYAYVFAIFWNKSFWSLPYQPNNSDIWPVSFTVFELFHLE